MNDEQRSPVSGAPAEDMSGGGLDDAVAALQAQREQMQQSAPESIEDEPVLTAQPEEVHEDDSEDQAEDQLTDDVSESPEGEPPEESDSPTVYEWNDDAVFLVDGEEISADALKRGIVREADYTRKTQQVAELRKSAEAQSQTAFAAVQAAQALLRSDLSKFEAIDWSELAGNPTEFQRKQAM